MEESEHIKKLEELIPKLQDITISNSPQVEYNVKNGTSFGFNLYNIPEIALQRVFMSKGTIFPTHCHEENEYVLVYKGKCEVFIDDDEHKARIDGKVSNSRILGVGDAIYFPPNMPHSGKALEDTWIISVTIPAGEGYPDEQ